MLIYQPDDIETLFSDDVPMTYRRPPDDLSDDPLYPKGYIRARLGAARLSPGLATTQGHT